MLVNGKFKAFAHIAKRHDNIESVHAAVPSVLCPFEIDNLQCKGKKIVACTLCSQALNFLGYTRGGNALPEEGLFRSQDLHGARGVLCKVDQRP